MAGLVVLVLLAPSRGAAQDPVPPPQQPLAPTAVAPPVTPKVTPRRLLFGLSLFEGYDLTKVSDGRPGLVPDNRIRQDASFSGLSASLNYSQVGEEKEFGVVGGTDLRYYSIAPEIVPVNFYGATSLSTRLGRRIGFRGSVNAGYSPYYSFGGFLTPGTAPDIHVPDTNQTIARVDTYTTGSSATLSWMLSRRSSLYGGYVIDYVTTPEASYGVFTQGGNAGWQRQMTRYTGLRLGYGFRRSRQIVEGAPSFDMHTLDTGISYRRPLSSSRRTTVGFNAGSVLLEQGGVRMFTATGDGSLTYQMKRTWTTGVTYQRSVGKVGGLLAPFVTDGVWASLGGRWTRHLGLLATGGYSRGSAALRVDNGYDALYGSGRLHYDLGRYVPVYVEYVYYRYAFSQSLGLAPGFPISVQRHGIRVGLGYSVPLVGERVSR